MDPPILESLQGHFLMAMPNLLDPNFYRTVTFLCEHTHEGAMGIVVDRIHEDIAGEQIFKELNISYLPENAKIPIHFGGPVHMNEIFILHGAPFHWESCSEVSTGFALSNTMDILAAIAMGRGPSDYMIALGCSGWAAGQLEMELKENAWLTCPATMEIAFEVPEALRWETAIKRMGIDPDLISDTAGHA
ncbi:MAG: YqgE/AlgH family protein [Deltaproteobacteria bacterium]|nr:YqgE/AlgH family protein [Deltaproteobacteria bacterium]